jgi:hypothetical protein
MSSKIIADTIESKTTDGNITISGNGDGSVVISDSVAISGTTTITGAVSLASNLSVGGATVSMPNLPTSDPGVAGSLWRNGTDLKVSTG